MCEVSCVCKVRDDRSLVHVLSAPLCAAATWNLVVFNVELVVVCQLFAGHNSPECEDDDVLLTENINDL